MGQSQNVLNAVDEYARLERATRDGAEGAAVDARRQHEREEGDPEREKRDADPAQNPSHVQPL